MFTFKKIALLGAAGLAALSMSCSDPADDPSGTFTGLTITDSDDGIFLAGTITGNEGITVSTVTATANGTAVEVKGISLPKSPVDLAGAYLSGVCAIAGTATYTIEITATFSDGTTVSDSKSVSVTCGSVTPPPAPAGYTLSSAGTSYLDVDEGKTYTQSQLTAAIKETIDLVAYAGVNAAGVQPDNIYSGYWENVLTLGDASLARIFNTQAALIAAQDDDEAMGEEKIAITGVNQVFYLISDEQDSFKVTVTAFVPGSSVTLLVVAL